MAEPGLGSLKFEHRMLVHDEVHDVGAVPIRVRVIEIFKTQKVSSGVIEM